MITQTLEGIWEDIASRAEELKGRRVRVTVFEDETPNGKETMQEKADRVLQEAGLISSIKFPNAKKLTDEERRRIGKLFSGEKSLGDYIDEDREARG